MGGKHTKKCKGSDMVDDRALPDGGHRDSRRVDNNENQENEDAAAVPEWDCVITTDVVWEHKSDGLEWVNSYVLQEVSAFYASLKLA